CQQHDSPRTF
nr:immunoglobulin light chain junction region [Macaca mulatta]MOV78776.1 immunoglobulin light chain junction region [Macaca mulatta]